MAQYKHQSRTNGDTILAEEWNNMGLKVESLNSKFNEESSVISGPLSVGGNLIASQSLTVGVDGTINRNLTVKGNLSVDGVITAKGILNVTNEASIGRSGSQMRVGYVGFAGYAGISNIASANTAGYALIQNGSGKTYINTASGQNLSFREGNGDRMIIAAGGNVGIGTTAPSNAQSWNRVLDVRGTANSKLMATSNNAAFRTGIYAHSTWLGGSGLMGTESNHNLHLITNYSPKLTILTSGNVGIGNTNPTDKLYVNGDATLGRLNSEAKIGFVGYAGWAGFAHKSRASAGNYALMQHSSGMTMLNSSSGQNIYFRQGNSDRMVINSTGNVGVGTSSPSEKLDVNGNLNIRGKATLLSTTNPINFTSAWSNTTGARTDVAEISNDTGTYKTLMIIGNRSNSSTIRRVSVWDRLEVNGTLNVTSTTTLRNTSISGTLSVSSTTTLKTTNITGTTTVNGNFYQNYGGNQFRMFMNSQNLVFYIKASAHGANRYMRWDGDTNWDSYSDKKLKTDIKKEVDILDRLLKLDVKSYRWKGGDKSANKSLGFMAQDVQPLFPNLVSDMENPETKETHLTLKQGAFGVLAIGGIKELKKTMDKEMAALKKQITELKKKVNAK